jgi:hypothetical protein
MIYEIWCDGKLVAKFKNQSDRDFCLSALKEAYDDCVWTTMG